MLCTGIGFLIILVFGWIKASEWNIKGLMAVYTGSLLVGFVLSGVGYVMMGARIAREVRTTLTSNGRWSS